MKFSFNHGGNVKKLAEAAGIPEENFLDFSASINPLGFPEWLRPLISSKVSDITKYPDPNCGELVEAMAKAYGCASEEIVTGNGATEIIYGVARLQPFTKAIIPQPAYVDYRAAAESAGLDVTPFPLTEESGFEPDMDKLGAVLTGGELVIIGHPNNPTGKTINAQALRELAKQNPSTIFALDEAFGGFVEPFDSLIVNRPDNVIVMISSTKLFAIPGIRLGLAVCGVENAEPLRKLMLPWSVNVFAQAIGARAAADTDFANETKRYVAQWRESLFDRLNSIKGITVFEGEANYLLAKTEGKQNAHDLFGALIKKGIGIRVCENFEGLNDRFFRVAVRTEEENTRLVEALKSVMAPGASAIVKPRRRTPAIMFQGVSSNSGKSVLAAAMCRIMRQDGFSVAPFKSQNMALNSYVTLDGKEIGRAQVTQAQGCGLEPDTRMNPILLKPNTDTGAQVILLGEPVGSMNVKEYFSYKKEGFDTVKQAYDSLSAEYEVMVLEGAGSPGEVNLKQGDIVNMRMAEYADAEVLIVGDIDRGGVFASFIGIMETLAEWERKLTAGFVINRFRGDPSLLGAAIEYTDSVAGKPTFGIVPYIKHLGLPEEDQVIAPVFHKARHNGNEKVSIAVVRLRHTSNFTDFDPLMMEDDVNLWGANKPDELDGADIVIIPGSKNVVGDIGHITENGMGEKLAELNRNGLVEIVGVCGGFQALGARVSDPDGIESSQKHIQGLNLLQMETTLLKDKTLARVDATHIESDLPVCGYEIHHGESSFGETESAMRREDGKVIGVRSRDGMTWGTYLHGMFNDDRFRRWFIDRARARKGLPQKSGALFQYDVDAQLDKLADVVRENMDVKKIYSLIGLR